MKNSKINVYAFRSEDSYFNYIADSNSKAINVHGTFGSVLQCPFCNAQVEYWRSNWVVDQREEEWKEVPNDELHCYCGLRICRQCGWWRELLISWEESTVFNTVALLKKSDVSVDDAPLSELRRILARDWKYSKSLSPQRAEDLVCHLFREHLNCEVHYFPKSVYGRDKGIDFVLVQTDSGIRYAFQVKRRLADKSEPVSEVRAFIGALALSPFCRGFYVTTAHRFTSAAEQELRNGSANLSKANLGITFIDGRRLHEIVLDSVPIPEGFMILKARHGNYYCWWRDEELPDGTFEAPYTGGKSISEILEI